MKYALILKSILFGMLFLSLNIFAWGISETDWPSKLKESCDNYWVYIDYLKPSSEYSNGLYVKISWRVNGRFYDTHGVLLNEFDDSLNGRDWDVYDHYNEDNEPVKQFYFYCPENEEQDGDDSINIPLQVIEFDPDEN